MVHAILLRPQLGPVLREGEHVGRRVDFGNDFHVELLGEFLQFDEFGLRVVAVLGGEAGIGVALESEGRRGLVPVVFEILLKAVVVEVQLQRVHLVIGHHAHEVAQIVDGHELATHVEHETAQAILRNIDDGAAGYRGS